MAYNDVLKDDVSDVLGVMLSNSLILEGKIHQVLLQVEGWDVSILQHALSTTYGTAAIAFSFSVQKNKPSAVFIHRMSGYLPRLAPFAMPLQSGLLMLSSGYSPALQWWLGWVLILILYLSADCAQFHRLGSSVRSADGTFHPQLVQSKEGCRGVHFNSINSCKKKSQSGGCACP